MKLLKSDFDRRTARAGEYSSKHTPARTQDATNAKRLKTFMLALGWLAGAGSVALTGDENTLRARPASSVLRLSLRQAIQIALEEDGNAKVRLSDQFVLQAKAQSAVERAGLLPNLDASASQQSRTTNLEAVGIQFSLPFPGFQPPQFVGPFDTFDARFRATQALWDVSAIRRFQASRAAVGEAQLQRESVKNEVAALVAGHYLAALRADARVLAARANVDLAQQILGLAHDQKQAGTGTRIEVTRAEVQLANERQQQLLAENQRRREYLELLRAIGLGLDTEISLSQSLAGTPIVMGSLTEAVQEALNSRADFLAQKKREEKLKLQRNATQWERLPSLYGFADYGSLGSSIRNALPTRSIGISLTVPLFDGGRRDARRAEISSRFHQEKIRSEDLRAQIELEVRLAFDNLQSAEAQVRVAEEGVQLATAELEQSQRRYRSGVTTSLELTDAQTRLERARENRIAALFDFNRAKIEIGQATGTIQTMIQNGQLGD